MVTKYVIICDSTKNKNQILYLVDRNFVKDKWWSEYLNDAFFFEKIESAKFSLKNLKYNNPRIAEVKEESKERDRLPIGVL